MCRLTRSYTWEVAPDCAIFQCFLPPNTPRLVELDIVPETRKESLDVWSNALSFAFEWGIRWFFLIVSLRYQNGARYSPWISEYIYKLHPYSAHSRRLYWLGVHSMPISVSLQMQRSSSLRNILWGKMECRRSLHLRWMVIGGRLNLSRGVSVVSFVLLIISSVCIIRKNSNLVTHTA